MVLQINVKNAIDNFHQIFVTQIESMNNKFVTKIISLDAKIISPSDSGDCKFVVAAYAVATETKIIAKTVFLHLYGNSSIL